MTSVIEWIEEKIKNEGLVALKIIFNDNSKEKLNEVNEEFVKELKLLREIDYHSNINHFLGVTNDSMSYILVLEYANEGNLRDYLRNNFASLEWNHKIQMALDITNGLKFLHSKEIIHRDLQKLQLSSMGNKMGMYEYIEPQCIKNIKYKKDKKSDIYSLGVLLWEISSGSLPFHDYRSNRNILAIHISYNNLREEPIKGTPLKYQQLYQKCWDDEPKLRPDIEEVYKILNKGTQ
ncbi:kinase-like domain-containing protein [Rhizophagus irregularis DAOM 181602=DAOM 197198]|uniref:Kinase-like domain-containing protein n=1 Tax=Rhizophagus irregularis (strain DAOM 181602 / DAOM 197198 / MUCL 43194) TaxID=747089 RepID=A0A2P4QP36_RHIID|nr:kinase-like domain-containing protein [Rhizophagus irregularis DAOM 181602=DAOM 197198]POG79417.1 kinase-like domain-containing protein [Rhizophagus irregularis DAOM 181602=DAOM 197198]|eukprot:XP_025186283.1 kinase-like domain-containing protein [Rhizophagus irregularis DAOM 181602=DAOM 197198]